MLGDLTIDYAQRRVSLGRQFGGDDRHRVPDPGRACGPTPGGVLTYEHLLRRVWRLEGDADLRPMRSVINRLRRKLGENAEDPTYIFTELRVGYRMPKGETGEGEEIVDPRRASHSSVSYTSWSSP